MNAAVRIVAACIALLTMPASGGVERAISLEVVVDAAPEQVWDAWTTRSGVTSFLAPDARVEARVGGAFQIYFDPSAPVGRKGADDMRYMALQPTRMLSFDWNAPVSLPDVRSQRTFVIVRFEPVGDRRTRVHLHHSGWGQGGEWDEAYAFFEEGWGTVLARLKQRFETGPIAWTGTVGTPGADRSMPSETVPARPDRRRN